MTKLSWVFSVRQILKLISSHAVCARVGDLIILNICFPPYIWSGHIKPYNYKSCWRQINVLYKEKSSGGAYGRCPDQHAMTCRVLLQVTLEA